MLVSFELTMPNIGSWNGIWTGQKKGHFIVKKCSKEELKRINLKEDKASFHYNFGDGWGATVKVEKVDSKTANKRRKNSNGFCNYDWMVDEIIQFGRIKEISERIIKA